MKDWLLLIVLASKKNAESLSNVLSTIEPIYQMSEKFDDVYNLLGSK